MATAFCSIIVVIVVIVQDRPYQRKHRVIWIPSVILLLIEILHDLMYQHCRDYGRIVVEHIWGHVGYRHQQYR